MVWFQSRLNILFLLVLEVELLLYNVCVGAYVIVIRRIQTFLSCNCKSIIRSSLNELNNLPCNSLEKFATDWVFCIIVLFLFTVYAIEIQIQ